MQGIDGTATGPRVRRSASPLSHTAGKRRCVATGPATPAGSTPHRARHRKRPQEAQRVVHRLGCWCNPAWQRPCSACGRSLRCSQLADRVTSPRSPRSRLVVDVRPRGPCGRRTDASPRPRGGHAADAKALRPCRRRCDLRRRNIGRAPVQPGAATAHASPRPAAGRAGCRRPRRPGRLHGSPDGGGDDRPGALADDGTLTGGIPGVDSAA